jgi:hypothetical protein
LALLPYAGQNAKGLFDCDAKGCGVTLKRPRGFIIIAPPPKLDNSKKREARE